MSITKPHNKTERGLSKSDRNIAVIVIVSLILAAAMTGYGSFKLQEMSQKNSFLTWSQNILTNVSAGCFSSMFTYVMFEIIIVQRRRRELEEKANKKIDQELYSSILKDNNKTTAEKQRAVYKMIEDDLFEYSDLDDANLSDLVFTTDKKAANFHRANVRRATMTKIEARAVNFEGTNLTGSNLSDANCYQAIFFHAIVRGVNFKNAKLQETNFQEVEIIDKINFEGACLSSANFDNAKFLDPPDLDQNTQFPDGSLWRSGTKFDTVAKEHRYGKKR